MLFRVFSPLDELTLELSGINSGDFKFKLLNLSLPYYAVL
jgi:hypothetical protein